MEGGPGFRPRPSSQEQQHVRQQPAAAAAGPGAPAAHLPPPPGRGGGPAQRGRPLPRPPGRAAAACTAPPCRSGAARPAGGKGKRGRAGCRASGPAQHAPQGTGGWRGSVWGAAEERRARSAGQGGPAPPAALHQLPRRDSWALRRAGRPGPHRRPESTESSAQRCVPRGDSWARGPAGRPGPHRSPSTEHPASLQARHRPPAARLHVVLGHEDEQGPRAQPVHGGRLHMGLRCAVESGREEGRGRAAWRRCGGGAAQAAAAPAPGRRRAPRQTRRRAGAAAVAHQQSAAPPARAAAAAGTGRSTPSARAWRRGAARSSPPRAPPPRRPAAAAALPPRPARVVAQRCCCLRGPPCRRRWLPPGPPGRPPPPAAGGAPQRRRTGCRARSRGARLSTHARQVAGRAAWQPLPRCLGGQQRRLPHAAALRPGPHPHRMGEVKWV